MTSSAPDSLAFAALASVLVVPITKAPVGISRLYANSNILLNREANVKTHFHKKGFAIGL